ncbi:unnamed protein product, partial [Symbiodinium necroappetens]
RWGGGWGAAPTLSVYLLDKRSNIGSTVFGTPGSRLPPDISEVNAEMQKRVVVAHVMAYIMGVSMHCERVLPSKVQCSHCGTWVADEGRLRTLLWNVPQLASTPRNMFMTFPTLFDFGERRGNWYGKSLYFGLSFEATALASSPSFEDYLLDIAPHLDGHSYKGQSGRIGVLGGSPDFAGAPYYAGMAALRVGAELLYMCTEESATGPIKGYSPELMVSE